MKQTIGIPKEIKIGEERVALTPEEVRHLTALGLDLFLETKAGMGSGFIDEEYRAAGARILANSEELYDKASLIVKVKEPQESELQLLREDHQLFCYLHLGGNPQLTERLLAIGLTGYAFETLSSQGTTPLLAPMSRIAGRLAVQMGAGLLHKVHGGKGTLLGGTQGEPEGRVSVIGAGNAGKEAMALALGMGAQVRIIDVNQGRLAQLKEEFPRIETAPSDEEGIAWALSEVDLLIGSVYLRGKKAPHVIDERSMLGLSRGTVAVDIAIDQGGCFATSRPCTHLEPYYEHEGILHSAITNLPAAVPRTASMALAKAILPYLADLAQNRISPELESALNLKQGQLMIQIL